MKITLLIPTLNEIEGMKKIMPRIRKEWVDEILIIDGNSTDGTYEYAKEMGYWVVRQNSTSLMNSYYEALDLATGDVLITFSPDGNSVPERIPALVDKIKEGYDMVIVSRYCRGAQSEDDDFLSAFGNWFFTRLINGLFGSRYTDTLVMFRAWKKGIVQYFQNDVTRSGFEPSLCIQCAKHHLKVVEIPGDEPLRISGRKGRVNKLKAGLGILILILKEFFNHRDFEKGYRPPSTRRLEKERVAG